MYRVPEYSKKFPSTRSSHTKFEISTKHIYEIITNFSNVRIFFILATPMPPSPLFLSLFLRRCPALFSRWCRIHPVFPSVPFPILGDLSRRDSSPLDRSKSNPRFILVAECDPFNGITRLRRSKLFTTPTWTNVGPTRGRDLMQHAWFMTSWTREISRRKKEGRDFSIVPSMDYCGLYPWKSWSFSLLLFFSLSSIFLLHRRREWVVRHAVSYAASTRRDLPISHLRGLLRDASMLGRLQSFSLKSFLVRDFSCPSCDNSACVVPLSFIYTLLLFNSVFPFLFSRSSRSFFSSVRVITNISNVSSLSFTTLVTLANNLIAFLSRSQLFSRLFVPELRLSKNEQFIPVYRFRSSRSVEESPNQFASDQSPPFQRPTFAGSPFPSPLLHAAIVFQWSRNIRTSPAPFSSVHPSVHPAEGDRKIEIVIQRVLAGWNDENKNRRTARRPAGFEFPLFAKPLRNHRESRRTGSS